MRHPLSIRTSAFIELKLIVNTIYSSNRILFLKKKIIAILGTLRFNIQKVFTTRKNYRQ